VGWYFDEKEKFGGWYLEEEVALGKRRRPDGDWGRLGRWLRDFERDWEEGSEPVPRSNEESRVEVSHLLEY